MTVQAVVIRAVVIRAVMVRAVMVRAVMVRAVTACPVRGPRRASAGAALALATALRDREEALRPADLLLLAYPFAHFPVPALDSTTAVEMAALPPTMRFTTADVEFMVENYVGRLIDLPRDALPGAAPLHGLPPVHLLVCEYDDLRPSAELLARQLTACEVEVSTYLAAGMPHGHLNRTPALAEVDRSLGLFADALR